MPGCLMVLLSLVLRWQLSLEPPSSLHSNHAIFRVHAIILPSVMTIEISTTAGVTLCLLTRLAFDLYSSNLMIDFAP